MSGPFTPGNAPRMRERADQPGSYALAVKLATPVIDPGELVEGEVFILGYGAIEGSKLTFYPSLGLFDEAESHIRHGFVEAPNGVVTFGGQSNRVNPDGVTISFSGGFQAPGWPARTQYFDLHSAPSLQIATETKHAYAPVSFALKTRPKTRPGEYSLQFFFTYFNGANWKTSSQTISFKVRNILQRHELLIAFIAALAAAVTIIPGMEGTVGVIQEWWRAVTGCPIR